MTPAAPPRSRPRSGLNVNVTTPLGQLVLLLERYVASLTIDSMLRRSLDRLEMPMEAVTARNLDTVVEEVMVGLRLFCDPNKLPELMVELAELCHRLSLPPELAATADRGRTSA
jgi:hypothetical protein